MRKRLTSQQKQPRQGKSNSSQDRKPKVPAIRHLEDTSHRCLPGHIASHWPSTQQWMLWAEASSSTKP